MADVIRYVDPGVVGGLGNGTSWANAYSSMNAWNVAEATNLVTSTTNHYCYFRSTGGVIDTTPTTIDTTWTTSTTYKLYLTGDVTEAKWDTSKYIFQGSNLIRIMTIYAGWVVVSNMQFEITGLNAHTQACLYANGSAPSSDIWIKNCIVKSANQATYRERAMSFNTGTGRTLRAWNCIVWNVNNTIANAANVALYVTGVGNKYFYNNTFSGGYNSVQYSTGGNVEAINDIFVNAGSTVAGTWSNSDYNTSDKATTTGGASDQVNKTFTFVNSATGDFTLKSSDAGAKGFGTDLTANANIPFNYDIAAKTRTVPWDCGASKSSGLSGFLLNGGLLKGKLLQGKQ
jgi:hypothetical protein